MSGIVKKSIHMSKYDLDHREFYVDLGSWTMCYPDFKAALKANPDWYKGFKYAAGGFNYQIDVQSVTNDKKVWKLSQTNLQTNKRRNIEGRWVEAATKDPDPDYPYGVSIPIVLPSRDKDKTLDIANFIEPFKVDRRKKSDKEAEQDCSICMDTIKKKSGVKFMKCKAKHGFHSDCIKEWWTSGQYSCPLCQTKVAPPIGKCPAGTLTVTRFDKAACPFPPDPSVGVIQLYYSIPGGTQNKWDDNPGKRFSGTTRYGFLPDTPEGRKAMRRLINAWKQRLTFKVGTSITNGTPNTVVWTGIHHKTNLQPGTWGYPDPTYIARVQGECDDYGVLPVEDKKVATIATSASST